MLLKTLFSSLILSALLACSALALDTRWGQVPYGFSPFTGSYIFDDFYNKNFSGNEVVGQIGQLGWGSQISDNLGTNAATECTYTRINDAAAPTGSISIVIPINAGFTWIRCATFLIAGEPRNATGSTVTYGFRLSMQNGAVSGHDEYRFGYITEPAGGSGGLGTGGLPIYGFYVEKLSTDTNWFCVARKIGGIQTRVDTGVAAVTDGSYHSFQLIYAGAGALVGSQTCVVDGTAVQTGQLYGISSNDYGTFDFQFATDGTVATTVRIDYAFMNWTGLTR